MAEGFRFIYLDFRFSQNENLSLSYLAAKLTQVFTRVRIGCVIHWDFWDLRKSRELSSCLRTRESRFRARRGPDEFVRYGRRALIELRADDLIAVGIERLCVSLLMSKNLQLKGNKVSYLNQFRVFGFLYVFEHSMNLCLFHIAVS